MLGALSEELKDFMEAVDDPWKEKGLSEVWNSLADQLLGQPFADIGFRRKISFKALGVTWNFQWENTYNLTATVEQFLAVLQIILADLAGVDLCLLRTTVSVDVVAGEGADCMLRMLPSNISTGWEIKLPVSNRSEGAGLDSATNEALAATISLLESASLMPGTVVNTIKDAFRDGLYTKAFSVGRYEALFCEFISREIFESSSRHLRSVPESGACFNPALHDQLKWMNGPGPGYSQEQAEEGVRNRYERTVRPIQRTIEWLARQQEFRVVARVLREEGWLDWHILLAVMHLVLNYRIQRALSLGLSQREVEELSDQWVQEVEKENNIPVPLAEFSVENLKIQLRFSMLATVKSHGLEIPHRTPDLEAISDFLGERYGYWTHDVEHADYGF